MVPANPVIGVRFGHAVGIAYEWPCARALKASLVLVIFEISALRLDGSSLSWRASEFLLDAGEFTLPAEVPLTRFLPTRFCPSKVE